ncbi:hypothetical protein [Streptomyces sp. LUP47B]|uniref:hypothetical protein n=1 Tax=Streptomyces sp. LUP47B TaxID=1890286 RepID=UPI000851F8CD|nr:hypothetical protein [Streptomyces sp. LUP47B]
MSISAPVLMAGLTGDIPAWNPLAHTPLAGRLDVHAPEDPEHRWQPWHFQARPVPTPTLGLPAAE